MGSASLGDSQHCVVAWLPRGRGSRERKEPGLFPGVRVEGFAVHQHVLDDRVAIVVDAGDHLHVIGVLDDVACALGHEVGANAEVQVAGAVDAAHRFTTMLPVTSTSSSGGGVW